MLTFLLYIFNFKFNYNIIKPYLKIKLSVWILYFLDKKYNILKFSNEVQQVNI